MNSIQNKKILLLILALSILCISCSKNELGNAEAAPIRTAQSIETPDNTIQKEVIDSNKKDTESFAVNVKAIKKETDSERLNADQYFIKINSWPGIVNLSRYGIFIFEDKVWANGLGIDTGKKDEEGNSINENNLWVSEDGIHFRKVFDEELKNGLDKSEALIGYSNKLYKMGWEYYYIDGKVLEDFYYLKESEDGIDWNDIKNPLPFKPTEYISLFDYHEKLLAVFGKCWTTTDGYDWKLFSQPRIDGIGDLNFAAAPKGTMHGNEIVSFGLNYDIFLFDGNTWEDANLPQEQKDKMFGTPDGRRDGFALVSYKGYLYILGGFGFASPGSDAYYDQLRDFASKYNDVWRSSDGKTWEQIARLKKDLPYRQETAARYFLEKEHPDGLDWDYNEYEARTYAEAELDEAYQGSYRAIYDSYTPRESTMYAVSFKDKIFLYQDDEIWTTENGNDWTLAAKVSGD